MTLRVTILGRARLDAESIYNWIHGRSPRGAAAWQNAFEDAVRRLTTQGLSSGFAPEADRVGIPLRQKLFRTGRGNRYRLLFIVVDQEVRILRVRGPGQPPVTPTDVAGN